MSSKRPPPGLSIREMRQWMLIYQIAYSRRVRNQTKNHFKRSSRCWYWYSQGIQDAANDIRYGCVDWTIVKKGPNEGCS